MLTTQKQVRDAFWQNLPDWLNGEARVRKANQRQNQYPTDTRVAFVDFVDWMNKDGQISDKLADKVTL